MTRRSLHPLPLHHPHSLTTITVALEALKEERETKVQSYEYS
jgi:hypothetical protein